MDDPKEGGNDPAIGSIMRFVSDWVSGEQAQSHRTTDQQGETAIEMQNLLPTHTGGTGKQNESHDLAVREWKRITNVDAFLEQVHESHHPPAY